MPQTLWSLIVPITLAPRLLEASGLALFASCMSPILGHARALLTNSPPLSRQRSLSFFSGLSLVSGLSRQRSLSLSRLSLSSSSLSSRGTSLARCATRLASRISSSFSSPSRVSPPSLVSLLFVLSFNWKLIAKICTSKAFLFLQNYSSSKFKDYIFLIITDINRQALYIARLLT